MAAAVSLLSRCLVASLQQEPSASCKALQNPCFQYRRRRIYIPGSKIFQVPKFRFELSRVRKESWFVLKAASAVSVVGNDRVAVRKENVVNPIIVIDNYDSFTYNLCQYMGEMGCNFEVYRNDELSVEELKGLNPRGILISPGPGTPQDSGICLQTVLELGPTVPIFGVCMGLQCMGEAFGGNIVRSPSGVMHGKSSPVYYDEKGDEGLLSGLPNPFTAGRYHSLVIENESFPSDALEITAWTEDGLIMAIRHKTYRHIQGVQFHPESIITTEGKTIVRNFIKLIQKFEYDCEKRGSDTLGHLI